jgi:hypothetical protein
MGPGKRYGELHDGTSLAGLRVCRRGRAEVADARLHHRHLQSRDIPAPIVTVASSNHQLDVCCTSRLRTRPWFAVPQLSSDMLRTIRNR